MKKLFILVAACGFVLTSCNKTSTDSTTPTNNTTPALTVEKKNRAVLMEFSETWCGPCGTYGAPAYDACMDMEGTITLLKVCASSTPTTMNATASSAISTDFGIQGVPSFFMNGAEQNAGGGVYSTVSANTSWAITQSTNFANMPVVAGIALTKDQTSASVTVHTKVQFFADQAAGKNYMLAVYLLEDKVIADQNSAAGTIKGYSHRNLLRACGYGNYKGTAINDNAVAITANQTFEKDYAIGLNTAWNAANLKVVAVIYDATKSGKPVFVNSNLLK